MAVTKGQGNPNWNREETILALDLYFELSGRPTAAASDKITELSELLRSLPYHRGAKTNERFRNPDGVKFKIQNLRSALTGEGLSNYSAMDKLIAYELGSKRSQARHLARKIREAVGFLTEEDYALSDDFEDEFFEGKSIFALHRKRERSPKLRRKLLDKLGGQGLICSICSMSRPNLPLEIQESLFEVHHLLPLSEYEEAKATKLDDVRLLCASCHRGIHKLMNVKGEFVGILEAKERLN